MSLNLYPWSPSTRRRVVGQLMFGFWSKIVVPSTPLNRRSERLVLLDSKARATSSLRIALMSVSSFSVQHGGGNTDNRVVANDAIITLCIDTRGDAVALLLGHRTCDLRVTGSSSGWAPLRAGFAQATYTYVPLLPSSILWYRPRGE